MTKLRSLPLLFFACTLAVSTSAQDSTGFRLGLKLAPNIAWMTVDSKDLESDGSRVGYTFGLVGEFPIGAQGTYYFSTGLLLNNIGGPFKAAFETDIDGVTTSVRSEQDLRLRMLEIPITMKLRTKSASPMNFYGQLGFSGALPVRARTDFTTESTANGTTTTTSGDDEDVLSELAFFKAALVVGGGLEYKASSVTLFLGLTFNNAFTNMLDGEAKTFVSEDDKSKLSANYLEFTAGVFF